MIAAMLKTFKPRMAPPEFCHPGCRRAAARGAAAPSLYTAMIAKLGAPTD
jgi:hypothetical protein